MSYCSDVHARARLRCCARRILVVFLFTAEHQVLAQQAAVTPAATPSADTQLEEIVVTSQKREERLQNVPISVSVLGGPALDSSTVVGVSEALNAVPGVATNQNYLGGGTTLAVRGVTASVPTFTGSSAVAYYLDAVPFGLVRSAVAPDSNAYDLERVEVLRGPQGTLYGSSALNGVVRILTSDADLSMFDLKARVSDSGTQYGGNNYRADVAVNMPIIQDKLAVRAVVGYEDDAGWIDQPNKSNVNDTRLQTYRLKVNAQPTQDLSIALSAWSSRDRGDAPSVGYDFNKSASVLDQPISTDYDAFGGKLTYQFERFALSAATSYLDYKNVGTLGLDVPVFNAADSLFITDINSGVLSEEINLNSTQPGPWRWSVGGIWRRATEVDLVYYTGAFAFVPSSHSYNTSKSYAGYGELTRLFFEGQLELTVGLRHFHDHESQNDQVGAGTPFLPADSTAEANTPRAVLTYHPAPQVMTYLSYSQGFRSGFPQPATVLFTYPDFPALRPDRLRNYELGSKGNFLNGKLAYDTSVYYMKWQDIQQELTVPFEGGPGTPAIVNGHSASGIGVDAALTAELTANLRIKADVSWNNLEMDSDVISAGAILFKKGDRPNGSAETTAGLGVDYGFALGSGGYTGRLALSGNYTSQQAYRLSGNAVQTGDPSVFTRASFSVEFPSFWTLSLYGDNLNNERGAPVKFFPGVPNWYQRVRPRTIGLQLQYRQH